VGGLGYEQGKHRTGGGWLAGKKEVWAGWDSNPQFKFFALSYRCSPSGTPRVVPSVLVGRVSWPSVGR